MCIADCPADRSLQGWAPGYQTLDPPDGPPLEAAKMACSAPFAGHDNLTGCLELQILAQDGAPQRQECCLEIREVQDEVAGVSKPQHPDSEPQVAACNH